MNWALFDCLSQTLQNLWLFVGNVWKIVCRRKIEAWCCCRFHFMVQIEVACAFWKQWICFEIDLRILFAVWRILAEFPHWKKWSFEVWWLFDRVQSFSSGFEWRWWNVKRCVRDCSLFVVKFSHNFWTQSTFSFWKLTDFLVIITESWLHLLVACSRLWPLKCVCFQKVVFVKQLLTFVV